MITVRVKTREVQPAVPAVLEKQVSFIVPWETAVKIRAFAGQSSITNDEDISQLSAALENAGVPRNGSWKVSQTTAFVYHPIQRSTKMAKNDEAPYDPNKVECPLCGEIEIPDEPHYCPIEGEEVDNIEDDEEWDGAEYVDWYGDEEADEDEEED